MTKQEGQKSIYISLPITNHEDTVVSRNYGAMKYIKHVLGEYYVSPLDLNNIHEEDLVDHTLLEKTAFYMGRDIESVILCDAILLCPGWENSKGCKVEKYTAEIYGKEILYLEDPIKDINGREINFEQLTRDDIIYLKKYKELEKE